MKQVVQMSMLQMSMMRNIGGKWPLVLVAMVLGGASVAVASEHLPTSAVLDLPNGGSLSGRLLDAPAEAGGPRKTFFWKSPAFAEALEFAIDGVVGIRFQTSDGPRRPGAGRAWRVELGDGTRLVGSVDAIDDTHVLMDIGPAEAPVRLRIRRDAVRSIFHGESAAMDGEIGRLAGWRQSPPKTWREDVSRIVSTAAGTSLSRRLRTGTRARYDVRLSWQQRPTIRLELGGGADGEPSGRSYRLELLPEGMVAVREEPASKKGGSRVDLEPFGGLPERGLECSLFVDREAGRLAVMLPGGREPAADLIVPPTDDADSAEGVVLSVVEGSVAIDGIGVSPWGGGSLIRAQDDGAGAILLRDGGALAAVVGRMEPDSGQLTVRERSGEARSIPVETVAEIVFPSPANIAEEVASAAYPRLLATDIDGSRLKAHLEKVEQGNLWLACRGIEDPVHLPLTTLATLVSVGQPTACQALPGRMGRLECEEGAVWGCFVDGDGAGHAEGHNGRAQAIAWRPLGSVNASGLASAADGEPLRATIVYVEAHVPAARTADEEGVGGIGCHIGATDGLPVVRIPIAGSAAEAAGIKSGDVILAIAPRGDGRFVETERLSLEDAQHLLRGRVGSRLQLRIRRNGEKVPPEIMLVRQPIGQFGRNPQLVEQALQVHDRLVPPGGASLVEGGRDPFGSLLILRTGETMRCRIDAIQEQGVQKQGVRVQCAGRDPVTIASDLVQAIELVTLPGKQVSAEKFRSLTVLPRSQRQHPPTHVLRSIQGDYLRGRVISMDERTIRFAMEAHSNSAPAAIPRGDIARVIWLHPEDLDAPWKPPIAPAGEGLLVEAVDAADHRLRMQATGITGNMLHGRSAILNLCSVDLDTIDRLLVGGGHSERPYDAPFSQWRLQPAPEPRNRPTRGAAEGKDD